MRQRCHNRKNPVFNRYGDRGITICERWQSYRLFEQDMLPRPSPKHSIDRVDNNGNYEPGNVRWATHSEQVRNRRDRHDAIWVTIDGQRYRAADLAHIAGKNPRYIVARAASGLSYEEVISRERRWNNSNNIALATAASVKKRRSATHCKHGHEFTEANTRITPQGHRKCRACHLDKQRRRQGWYERHP
jgi:hypothetical protein